MFPGTRDKKDKNGYDDNPIYTDLRYMFDLVSFLLCL